MTEGHRPVAAPSPHDLEARLRWFESFVLPQEAAFRVRLRRIVRDPGDIDDVVAEVFARAFDHGDPDRVSTAASSWLLQIARNLLIDRARRERIVRFDLLADIDLLNDERAAERGLIARDELRRVQIALDALPPQQRRAFLLRRIDGHSMREVADIMALSVSTVEKHVARALCAMMQALAEDGTDT